MNPENCYIFKNGDLTDRELEDCLSRLKSCCDSNVEVIDISAILDSEKTVLNKTILPDDVFIRIHRSYILNINFLNQLEIYDRHGYTAVTLDNNKLPVSRQGVNKLKKAIHME